MTTTRQSYALANPLSRADNDPRALAPYMTQRRHRIGVILRSILAVDR